MLYRLASMLALALAISGCGGGGGGGSTGGGGGGGGGAGVVDPLVTITMSASSFTAEVPEDAAEATLSFTASQSGASGAVFPELLYDKAIFTLDGAPPTGSGPYNIVLKTVSDLGGGQHKGSVVLRLCKDAACAALHNGGRKEFDYDVTVKLKDWQMFQRNAGHTGYVNASYDPAKFVKAWEWTAPGAAVSPIASRGDTVFVTSKTGYVGGAGSVVALNGVNGSPLWNFDFIGASASAPSVSGNQVHVTSMVTSSGNNPIYTLRADSGAQVRRTDFPSQWSAFLPPTPYKDGLYMSAGYYGNQVYGFNTETGASRWSTFGSAGQIWDAETPAVDENYVYYYSGALDIINRGTGTLAFSIPDPDFSWAGYSYMGAPVLGSLNNVIVSSGAVTPGQQSGLLPVSGFSRPLISYALATKTRAWRSANVYATTVAVSGGVVYAGRVNPGRLDALDEATGAILWSWTPPAGTLLGGNILLTKNLVFVSTSAGLYAIRTSDHTVAWTYPSAGMVAITAGHMLVISEGAFSGGNSAPVSTGKLVAIKLN